MAKYKRYNYSQKVFIPVSLEDQLMPGTLEFVIHTLIESRIDMSVFDDRYNNEETGRYAYDPKILLKIVLFAYSRGLTSSRPIERACKENVTFMALTCGAQPDHSTIAAFVSSMEDEIPSLFSDVLLVCEQEDLLGGTFFALDGCKLPSNASKQWSGKISEIHKKKDRLERKVRRLLKKQIEADKEDEDKVKVKALPDRLNRQKQIERLQKKADRIGKWLEGNDAKIGRQGREIKSNITDNESGTKVSTHGTIQGYNGQALVDDKHQVIVQAEVFGEGQDHHHVPPLIDGAKANMAAIGHDEDYFEGSILTADALYHGPNNLKKCEAEGIDAYIPDKDFRKRAPGSKTKQRRSAWDIKRFRLKDFRHCKDRDVYICPRGKVLKFTTKATYDGIFYRQYVTDASDCMRCELKARCIRVKKGKRKYLNVPVGSVAGNRTKAMADKIDSKRGRKIYNRRMAIVEPVFGNIRFLKRLDRFTLRGKIKVNIQWLLYCMVHNIEKVTNYGFA
jgi:transposase